MDLKTEIGSIVCAAIVGKDNEPLYVHCCQPADSVDKKSPADGASSLRFHYLVHTSLDVIEDKILGYRRGAQPVTVLNTASSLSSAPSTTSSTAGAGLTSSPSLSASHDLYLGLLFQVDDYRVYGYITNCKTKFVVVVQKSSTEHNLKAWFREWHNIYAVLFCNPFAVYGSTATFTAFPSFQQSLTRHIDSFGSFIQKAKP